MCEVCEIRKPKACCCASRRFMRVNIRACSLEDSSLVCDLERVEDQPFGCSLGRLTVARQVHLRQTVGRNGEPPCTEDRADTAGRSEHARGAVEVDRVI